VSGATFYDKSTKSRWWYAGRWRQGGPHSRFVWLQLIGLRYSPTRDLAADSCTTVVSAKRISRSVYTVPLHSIVGLNWR